LNEVHQLVLHTDGVNLLGNNINTTKKSIENLTEANKEVGLEVNEEKTEYMLKSRHQNEAKQ
jgi:hypothetical protein